MLVPNKEDKLYKRYKVEQKKDQKLDFLTTMADGVRREIEDDDKPDTSPTKPKPKGPAPKDAPK